MHGRKLNVDGVDFGILGDGTPSPRTIGFFAQHNVTIEKSNGSLKFGGNPENISDAAKAAFNLQKKQQDEAKVAGHTGPSMQR